MVGPDVDLACNMLLAFLGATDSSAGSVGTAMYLKLKDTEDSTEPETYLMVAFAIPSVVTAGARNEMAAVFVIGGGGGLSW